MTLVLWLCLISLYYPALLNSVNKCTKLSSSLSSYWFCIALQVAKRERLKAWQSRSWIGAFVSSAEIWNLIINIKFKNPPSSWTEYIHFGTKGVTVQSPVWLNKIIPNNKICCLYVVNLLDPNQSNWIPAIQWHFPLTMSVLCHTSWIRRKGFWKRPTG